MFYLILAIATSAMISTLMRISSEKIKNNLAMLVVSYLTSTLLAAAYTDLGAYSLSHPSLPLTALMAMVNGLLYVAGFVLMQWNIPKNGVVLTATYMRLGLIVCMALSVVLFQEIPTILQLIGFFLAVGAIILNGSSQSKGSARFLPGLLLILFAGGLSDTWVKVFDAFGDADLSDLFLLGTFLSGTVFCLIMMVRKGQRFGVWEILFGIGVAIPNYYNSLCLLKSLQTLPGIIVYPTFSVGTLLLITLLGICLFKERLSRLQWCSMGIILVALALLNS